MLRTILSAIIVFPILITSQQVAPAAYGPVAIYTVPATLTIAHGQSVAVEVWVESGGHPLDTAQIFLSYDGSKLPAYNIVADHSALYLLHSAWNNAQGVIVLLSAGKAWTQAPSLSGAVNGTRFRLATIYFGALTDAENVTITVVRRKPLLLSGVWYRGVLMCDAPPYPPDWEQEEPPC